VWLSEFAGRLPSPPSPTSSCLVALAAHTRVGCEYYDPGSELRVPADSLVTVVPFSIDSVTPSHLLSCQGPKRAPDASPR
jgi:hypothetical protein